MSNEHEYIECKSCFDDFDGDLLKLVPGVEQVPEFRQCKDIYVFTYGRTDKSRTMLLHPSTWNGFGAFFFTRIPLYARDKAGWISIDGCTTDDPLISVSASDVLRDGWVHNYRAILDNSGIWFTPFDGMMDLLYTSRETPKLSLTDNAKLLMEAAAIDWVVEASGRLLQAVRP